MRIALVPGVLALLPEYASLEDPVAPLRAACLDAVGWLGPAPRILADGQGERVAEALLAAVADRSVAGDGARSAPVDGPGLLVVGNGSARRTDASPGPYDARAVPFDDALGRALLAPDPAALRALDTALAAELWASVGALAGPGGVGDALEGARLVGVDYDAAPFGVQYWVTRWQA